MIHLKSIIVLNIVGLRAKGLSYRKIADELREKNIADLTAMTVWRYYKERERKRLKLVSTSSEFLVGKK